MSFSALVKSQYKYKGLINKAYETYKKSPKERLRKESYLLTRLESLEEKWKIFSETHRQLSLESPEGGPSQPTENLENVYDEVEETYIDYKSDIRETLEMLKQEAASSASHLQTTSRAENTSLKLPKISIPTFSGLYSEWTTFRDLYVSLIHDNPSIDNVQKMHYLKGHLTGEAEQ
ncbi:Uncharacterized protein OBRU01_26887, partial [Operophtera brumata]